MTCADSLNPSLGFAAVFGSGRGGVGDAHDAQQRRQAIRSLLAGQPHVSPDGRLRVLRTGGYVRYGDHADEVCFLLDDAQVPLAVARLGDFVDSGVFRVAGHDDSIPDGELPRRHITKDELIQDGTLRTALVQCGVLSEVDALAALKVTGPQRDLLSLLKRGFHIRYERLPQLARRTGADFDARTLDELRDMALAYARPTTPVVIALTLNGEQFCRNYLDQPAAAPLESRMRTADER